MARGLGILLLLAGACVGNKVDYDSEWRLFKRKYTKVYETSEVEARHFESFKASVDVFYNHDSNRSSFTVELNHLSDHISSDFPPTSSIPNSSDYLGVEGPPENLPLEGLPQTIDWRTTKNPLKRPVMTQVKNQFQCGACWAFAAAAAVESAVAMSTKIVESLSVQELIDCDNQFDHGCVGGNPVYAYPFILRHGLAAEVAYPYEGRKDVCRAYDPVSGIHGFRLIPSNNKELLKQWLTMTPVAVGLEGTHRSFVLYSGGIYDDLKCGNTINHAMLLVGYGHTNSGEEYWIAKNSWGREWGEDGYVRLKINGAGSRGLCGIHQAPSFVYGGYGGNVSDPPSIDAPQFIFTMQLRQSIAVAFLLFGMLLLICVIASLAQDCAEHGELSDEPTDESDFSPTTSPVMELTRDRLAAHSYQNPPIPMTSSFQPQRWRSEHSP